MANSDEAKQNLNILNPNKDQDQLAPSNADDDDDEYEADDDGDNEDDEADEDDEEEPPRKHRPPSMEAQLRAERSNLENLVRRLSNEKVPLRVHDVIIKGNEKTKEYVIEAEIEGVRKARTMQELLEAAGIANAKLQGLEIFDSVRITLDSGPPELPGTANVIVEVFETKSPLSGECGAYTKPAVRFRILCSCFVVIGFSCRFLRGINGVVLLCLAAEKLGENGMRYGILVTRLHSIFIFCR